MMRTGSFQEPQDSPEIEFLHDQNNSHVYQKYEWFIEPAINIWWASCYRMNKTITKNHKYG